MAADVMLNRTRYEELKAFAERAVDHDEDLVRKLRERIVELEAKLSSLQKLVDAVKLIAPIIGWQGTHTTSQSWDLHCEYCRGHDAGRDDEQVQHEANCPVPLLLAALEKLGIATFSPASMVG